jgi:hypothetical protein
MMRRSVKWQSHGFAFRESNGAYMNLFTNSGAKTMTADSMPAENEAICFPVKIR